MEWQTHNENSWSLEYRMIKSINTVKTNDAYNSSLISIHDTTI
jgi:hypothetical protein